MKTPDFWPSRGLSSTLLLPAACLYGIGAWADRRFTTPKRAPLPVISIGNVTAGGAGKTPTTLALLPILRAMGHTPHILTRGYKATARVAHRVREGDAWQTVGDEALLLAAAAPTWVGRDRAASAHAAARDGATVLLCDDALQHHALHKDISLLVIDGAYGLGNGRLLPAGPLREPLAHAAARCDAVALIGEDTQQLARRLTLPVFAAQLVPAADTAFLTGKRWLAFAGIGRPEKFFASLRAAGADLTATRTFADHHAYRADELAALQVEAKAENAQLITTCKDAVKLPPPFAATVATLPVALTFSDPAALGQLLARHLPQRPS
ncbi:MAG: tetraacyldisaccharide 4'-kinase [Alphaproteobacteria bacterium]|nr:tetraacyldisaccharide 4'-kinase [Alphaproteobacteria bacterium]